MHPFAGKPMVAGSGIIAEAMGKVGSFGMVGAPGIVAVSVSSFDVSLFTFQIYHSNLRPKKTATVAAVVVLPKPGRSACLSMTTHSR